MVREAGEEARSDSAKAARRAEAEAGGSAAEEGEVAERRSSARACRSSAPEESTKLETRAKRRCPWWEICSTTRAQCKEGGGRREGKAETWQRQLSKR